MDTSSRVFIAIHLGRSWQSKAILLSERISDDAAGQILLHIAFSFVKKLLQASRRFRRKVAWPRKADTDDLRTYIGTERKAGVIRGISDKVKYYWLGGTELYPTGLIDSTRGNGITNHKDTEYRTNLSLRSFWRVRVIQSKRVLTSLLGPCPRYFHHLFQWISLIGYVRSSGTFRLSLHILTVCSYETKSGITLYTRNYSSVLNGTLKTHMCIHAPITTHGIFTFPISRH